MGVNPVMCESYQRDWYVCGDLQLPRFSRRKSISNVPKKAFISSKCQLRTYISSGEDTIASPSWIISMRHSTTSDLCSAGVGIIKRSYSFSFFHSIMSGCQPRYKERNNDHMYVCQRNKCQTQLDYTSNGAQRNSFLRQIFKIMRNKQC